METAKGVPKSPVDIIDIRCEELDESLLKLMLSSLDPDDRGPRALSTLLLYDEAGLKLFEDITFLDEYYLTNAEIDALQRHAGEIAERLPEGSRLVELGSGNLRKVDILLRAFEEAKKTVEYFALDLSLPELHRTLSAIPAGTYQYVKCAGLHGTYDDGLAWLKRTETFATATSVLSLGSSMGNFSRDEAARFLHQFSRVLGPQDSLIIGLDSCLDPHLVFHAYNDSQGVTEAFYRNGLTHANRLLGYEGFKQDQWNVVGSYDEKLNCHEAHYVSLFDVDINGIQIPEGSKIHLERAYKYSDHQLSDLWQASGLIHQAAFGNEKGDYNVHFLSPVCKKYPTNPEEYASRPVPLLKDWQELWAAWDTVTRGMTSREELLSKPIKLRNDLIFYLGHIPGFCDIQLTKATGGEPTEPAAYAGIFERGIDPDVDNPEVCHDHSHIPDTWPPLGDIVQYQTRVRSRIISLIASGKAESDRKVGRAMWLAFEHEGMHLETYLYMLLQSPKAISPPGSAIPDFEQLAAEAELKSVPNQWFRVPKNKVKIGLEDPENDQGPDRYFGWDNEKPRRYVTVDDFEAQGRPISNGEYARYLQDSHSTAIPASWIATKTNTKSANSSQNGPIPNGFLEGDQDHTRLSAHDLLRDVSVRTVYGPIPLQYARHWPVMASYDELAAYAKWSDGRIPTLEEARSIYSYVEVTKQDLAQKVSSSLISAVNGHLSNDGVEETPPQARGPAGLPEQSGKHNINPRDNFIDLEGCNVGFSNWSPTAVTQNSNRLCGQSDFGGAWEWTSSLLQRWDGFTPQASYPGYTADFFDGKHNIILGGSWATHPRVAGRKTFINWYQRNYPYTWAGARLVRDIPAHT